MPWPPAWPTSSLHPGTYDELPFADRLGLLVDKEADARDSRRLAARLKAAKLRYPAAVEDIDFRAPQGPRPLGDVGAGPGRMGERAPQRARHRPDRVRQKFPRLRAGQRGCAPRPHCPLPAHAEVVRRPGPRPGRRPLRPHALPVRTRRRPRARRLLAGPGPGRGLPGPLEVVEDRSGLRSTVVASQLPVDKWHPSMADPTLADAVLDRVCQAAHRIALKGASMRKRQPGSEEADNA